jgi:nicotinamidase-related amidase
MFIPPGSHIIDKPCFDAFAYTSLAGHLQDHGIRNVFIAGVMTDVCVDATARRAVMEGYNTYICEDLVSTPNEQSGQQALAFFERYYGYVLESSQIRWEAA